jgi:adenylate kinase
MRLILLGPPGSGKGTQAQLLSSRLHLEHIGTGDLLRAAAHDQTPVGVLAKPYLDSGKLAPDDLVNGVIAERFEREDRPSRFVMDGYPRTLAQARAFDALLARYALPLTSVLLLHVEDDEIVHRLAGRWSCPKKGCKATYHTEINPPGVPGACDRCGTALIQRNDDKPETVRERLKVYHGYTEELIPYYRARCLLREASGHGSIEEVYNNMLKALRA